MMHRLLLSLLAVTLVGCGQSVSTPQLGDGAISASSLPKPQGTKNATFFTYMGLDNNLTGSVPYELNALEWVGSSTHLNALALVDPLGPKNTFRFYAQKDEFNSKIISPLEQVGKNDRNSASEKTLRDSLRWGFGSYPSRFKWLDFSSHGVAYLGVVTDDRTSSKEKVIAVPALARAIRDGAGKVDLVSFNACLMANMTAAYELRKVAEVMVASEDIIMSYGMNPYPALAAMAQGARPDARQVGRKIVLDANRKGAFPGERPKERTAGVVTISAIDLTKMDDLAASVDGLSRVLLAKLPTEGKAIKAAANGVKPFAMDGRAGGDWLKVRDLNEFLVQLRNRTQDREILAACQKVNRSLFNGGAILLSKQHQGQQGVARGISIYLPTDGKIYKPYREMGFAKATQWDEFLIALGQLP